MGLLLVCGGCDFTRTVEVAGPSQPPTLVVNSEVLPNRPWRVDVSRSIGAFEPGDPSDSTATVRDATVTVHREGEKQGTLRLDSLDQYSTRRFTPEAGTQYTVRVTAPELGTATATDRIPVMPPLRLSSDTLAGGTDRRRLYNRLLRLTIDDPAGVKNYYRIALQKRGFARDSASIDTIGLTDVYFQTRNRSIVEDMRDLEGLAETNFNSYSGRSATFTDVLFGGTEHTIRLRVDDQHAFHVSDFEEGDGYPRIEYILYVSGLSKDTYQFLRTNRLYGFTDENPFAEPVGVHSNVDGGYGIVAGRSTDTLRVEVRPGEP